MNKPVIKIGSLEIYPLGIISIIVMVILLGFVYNHTLIE